ncbi:Uncharacterised protein [Nocardiopsis dassonvillei]|jgi:hypothetical protein|nr:Uncharacterised protein [Nocardiopsis dassonvillei]
MRKPAAPSTLFVGAPRVVRGPGPPGEIRLREFPDYAAFARRMRRRRSEARSSSFSPPQVPYFSGREIA